MYLLATKAKSKKTRKTYSFGEHSIECIPIGHSVVRFELPDDDDVTISDELKESLRRITKSRYGGIKRARIRHNTILAIVNLRKMKMDYDEYTEKVSMDLLKMIAGDKLEPLASTSSSPDKTPKEFVNDARAVPAT